MADDTRQISIHMPAQHAALAGLREAFDRILLDAHPLGGDAIEIVRIGPDSAHFTISATERIAVLRLGYAAAGAEPRWVRLHASLLEPYDLVHVRVERGHLELVTSGPAGWPVRVVAKVFGAGAAAADWPPELLVACISAAADVNALLRAAPTKLLVDLHLDPRDDRVDLAKVARFRRVERLTLAGCTSVSELSPLTRLSRLDELDLTDCTQLSDLQPLSALKELSMLSVEGCTSLRDIAPLAAVERLFTLDVSRCTALERVAPLLGATRLFMVSAAGCTALTDLPSLGDHPSLDFVWGDDPQVPLFRSERDD